MKNPPLNIAIFGGSFDPPHLAHLAILVHLLEGGRFDLILVIPSGQHPFKQTQANFGDRLAMCEAAFLELGEKIQVLDVERHLSGYTVDLIAYLEELYPDAMLTFLGGSDLKDELSRWKDGDKLQERLRFEFLPRAPAEQSFLPPLSSTEIRERVKNHLPIDSFVPKAVEDFIRKKNLYA